jgi:hypothetical protein
VNTEEERVWLQANDRLIGEALKHYLTNGVWPETDFLQRVFDRQPCVEIDVRETYKAMPSPLRGPTAYPAERIALRIRAFSTPDRRATSAGDRRGNNSCCR